MLSIRKVEIIWSLGITGALIPSLLARGSSPSLRMAADRPKHIVFLQLHRS